MKKTNFLVLVLTLSFGLLSGITHAKLVACVGDSNTYGYGISNRINNCYPAQLELLLQQADADWEVRNFGVNGATVLRQGDIPYVNKAAYHQALASEPDVVIICFGPNGSRSSNRGYIQDSYVSDYIDLIDSFAALPSNPIIWICFPLKAFSDEWTISDEIIKNQIIPLTAQIASEKGLPIVDFYTAFKDSPDLYIGDGIHPNSSGAKLMAEIIYGLRARPDLNGDGIVDSADTCIVVDHWNTNEPSCDFAPRPFGDRIVNVQDLIFVAEHLFTDYRAIAQWMLDEKVDNIAFDSVGGYDAMLNGEPLWQPAGGRFIGALEFDGIDDYISTPFVLNPAIGSFSAFAWIKGGEPGHVMISQTGSNGRTWLGTDPSDGRLMTGLGDTYFGVLESESVITDGQWHHVGLVYDLDMLHRQLYVDGAHVAEDTTFVAPQPSSGGLHLGASKDLSTASFFSGLIDDVRIYNRVVSP